MGARPVAILDSLRFGAADHPRTPFLVRGVVGGIAHYGNCIGVPTVGGDVYFDAGYNGNILVNAFTLGIARKDRLFRAKAGGVGNPVMYVGARTGRDGIHGASLLAVCRVRRDVAGEAPRGAGGRPVHGEAPLEACLTLMEQDHIVAIQDMGAAGLTSSSLEMAGRGGAGMVLELDAYRSARRA
jgi:phosphoribosylformylglycinamidine synthase